MINENRDSGVISQVGSSQPSSHLGSSDTDPRSPDLVDSPVVQKSSFFKDSSTDDLASQVSLGRLPFTTGLEYNAVVWQLSDARSELEVLHKRINEVQREKKDLEAEFVELKENYSLLSSQSQTVSHITYFYAIGACHRIISLFYSTLKNGIDSFFSFFCSPGFLPLLVSFLFFCVSVGCNELGWSLDVYGSISCSSSGRPHCFQTDRITLSPPCYPCRRHTFADAPLPYPRQLPTP